MKKRENMSNWKTYPDPAHDCIAHILKKNNVITTFCGCVKCAKGRIYTVELVRGKDGVVMPRITKAPRTAVMAHCFTIEEARNVATDVNLLYDMEALGNLERLPPIEDE